MNSDLRTMLKGISEILFAILLAIIHNYTGSMITIWCSLLIGFLGFMMVVLVEFPLPKFGKKKKAEETSAEEDKTEE